MSESGHLHYFSKAMTVGRAVPSDTRDLRFESYQDLIYEASITEIAER